MPKQPIIIPAFPGKFGDDEHKILELCQQLLKNKARCDRLPDADLRTLLFGETGARLEVLKRDYWYRLNGARLKARSYTHLRAQLDTNTLSALELDPTGRKHLSRGQNRQLVEAIAKVKHLMESTSANRGKGRPRSQQRGGSRRLQAVPAAG